MFRPLVIDDHVGERKVLLIALNLSVISPDKYMSVKEMDYDHSYYLAVVLVALNTM